MHLPKETTRAKDEAPRTGQEIGEPKAQGGRRARGAPMQTAASPPWTGHKARQRDTLRGGNGGRITSHRSIALLAPESAVAARA